MIAIFVYLKIKKQTIMKQYFLLLALLCLGFSNAQVNTPAKNEPSDEIKISDFSMTITIDSEKDLKLLNTEEIASAFDEFETSELATFKIICNLKSNTDDVISNFSIKIEHKNQDKEAFMKRISKAIQVTKKYFNQSKNE